MERCGSVKKRVKVLREGGRKHTFTIREKTAGDGLKGLGTSRAINEGGEVEKESRIGVGRMRPEPGEGLEEEGDF